MMQLIYFLANGEMPTEASVASDAWTISGMHALSLGIILFMYPVISGVSTAHFIHSRAAYVPVSLYASTKFPRKHSSALNDANNTLFHIQKLYTQSRLNKTLRKNPIHKFVPLRTVLLIVYFLI